MLRLHSAALLGATYLAVFSPLAAWAQTTSDTTGSASSASSDLAAGSTSSTDSPENHTTDGFYIGGGIGGAFPRDTSPNGGAADGHTTFDDNLMGQAVVGFGFGNGFRTELEGAFRHNNVDRIRGETSPATGGFDLGTVMLNGIYDLDLSQYGIDTNGFMPHVGAGIGLAHVEATHTGPYTGQYLTHGDNVLAYQGIAGVTYPLSPNLKLDLDYHFVGTDKARFVTVPTGETSRTSLQEHEAILGIRYEFNAPPPPAPPPPAPPPVTPPPAPVAKAPELQRSFQVFFDFDKADITEAAGRVVQQAADTVKQGNIVKLTVTGHTDTVGSARYNQQLSERRAAAVKTRLVSDGVGAGEITTVGVGKSGLLVPTGDGVREPQNRRAEIVLE